MLVAQFRSQSSCTVALLAALLWINVESLSRLMDPTFDSPFREVWNPSMRLMSAHQMDRTYAFALPLV